MRFQTSTVSGLLRRALAVWFGERLRRLSWPSGLFYPVCLAFAGGLLAAVDADSDAPGFALGSTWLYRAEVGLAFMGAIYIVGMILWLAWHGRGFFELGAFGLTLKASDARRVETAGSRLTGSDGETRSFQREEIAGLKELDTRLSAIEERTGSAGDAGSTCRK